MANDQTEQATDDGDHTRQEIEQEGPLDREASTEQHTKIAQLLWQLVETDAQSRGNTETGGHLERTGQSHTVHKVVYGITEQIQPPKGLDVTVTMMTVTVGVVVMER